MTAPERSRRTLPLPLQLVIELRQHRTRQREERPQAGPAWESDVWGGLVFASERGGPLHGTSVSKRFRSLLSAAGIPTMRYHHLRHGAASLMAAQGVPPRVAMEVLGHAQISTTMNVYSHVTDESQRDAIDRLSSAIWDAS